MQEKNENKVGSLILENRKNLDISGVTDVDSFDEKTVCLFTRDGELTIRGYDLHIDAMSTETGNMTVTGDIYALIYGDKDKKNPLSALGKLFR